MSALSNVGLRLGMMRSRRSELGVFTTKWILTVPLDALRAFEDGAKGGGRTACFGKTAYGNVRQEILECLRNGGRGPVDRVKQCSRR